MKEIFDNHAFPVVWALGLLLSLVLHQPQWLLAVAILSIGYHLWRLISSASRLLRLALAFAAIGASASAANLLLHMPTPIADLAIITARVGTAGSWTLGLAASIDPVALRRHLHNFVWIRPIAEFVDTTIFHGGLLADQWRIRLEAARQRGARCRGPTAINNLGLVLGHGAIVAFDRSLAIEQTRWLRSTSTAEPSPIASPQQQVCDVVLLLADLSSGYGDSDPFLKISNLEVQRGEWIALVGASGSGKSTLLRLIAGLLNIEQGRMRRFDETFDSGPAGPDRRISLTLQNPDHQFLGSTPRDDLLWGLRQHGITGLPAEKRINEIFENLQILDLADQPLRTLSFGQRRLVALASALVTEPQILLCDEMTSGLDPINKSRVIDTSARHLHQGTTVIWATHDLYHLPRSVERIAVLKKGHLHFFGSITEGLSHQILETADLISPSTHHRPLSF